MKDDIALHKKIIISETQMKTQTIYRPLQQTIVKQPHLKIMLLEPLKLNNGDVIIDDLAALIQRNKNYIQHHTI